MVSSEDLGGGDVHTRLSGVADHLAENDEHAIAIARNIVANLNKSQIKLQMKLKHRVLTVQSYTALCQAMPVNRLISVK